MASTNKTTHYDLSQYIGTDKPTYLTDYNQDMSKIDTGINTAQTTATSADGKADAAKDAAIADAAGKYEYQQMPTVGCALIVRANLSNDSQHISGSGIQFHNQGFLCNDW